MVGERTAAAHTFSDAELRLLDALNAMSGGEFARWFRGSFEPSRHPIRAVTACDHILGGRLDRERVGEIVALRWT